MTDKPREEETIQPRPEGDQAGKAGRPAEQAEGQPKEIGGRRGPEPTRYGDWETGGICTDF